VLDFFGEPAGTRTQDHLIKSQVLYHLSYGLLLLPKSRPPFNGGHGGESPPRSGGTIGLLPVYASFPARKATFRSKKPSILRALRFIGTPEVRPDHALTAPMWSDLLGHCESGAVRTPSELA
jgi:hypothetical protein